MDRKTIESLREHYDATDLSAEIDAATAELPDETLTATSIRLPQALLARVRERASAAGLPATTLMRQWIAQCADGPSADAVVSVADLEQLIASRAHTPRSA